MNAVSDLDIFITSHHFEVSVHVVEKTIILSTNRYIDGMIFDKIEEIGLRIIDCRIVGSELTLSLGMKG